MSKILNSNIDVQIEFELTEQKIRELFCNHKWELVFHHTSSTSSSGHSECNKCGKGKR